MSILDKDEVSKLKNALETKALRQAGRFKQYINEGDVQDDSEMYDWQVDINLLTEVTTLLYQN